MNLQIQTNGSNSPAFTSFTFDSLENLKNKINEISKLNPKSTPSTTTPQFRIKKGIQSTKKSTNPLSLKDHMQINRNAFEQIRPNTTQNNNPSARMPNAEGSVSPKQNVLIKSPPIENNSNQMNQLVPNSINHSIPNSFSKSKTQESSLSQSQIRLQQMYASQTINDASAEKPLSRITTQYQFYKPQQHGSFKSDQSPDNDHLKIIGFQNHKYPFPPKTGFQLLPKDQSKGRKLSQQSNTYSRRDMNSIESVWANRANSYSQLNSWNVDNIVGGDENGNETSEDPSSPTKNQNENEKSQSSSIFDRLSKVKQEMKTSKEKKGRQEINSNKLMFSLNKNNRDINMDNLQMKIEDIRTSQSSKNLFPRWKPTTHEGGASRPVTSNQWNPRSSHESPPGLTIKLIDNLPQSDESSNAAKENKDKQKMKHSMSSIRVNQQSNSKKLTAIIEKYSDLIQKSKQICQIGASQSIRFEKSNSFLSNKKRSSGNAPDQFSDQSIFFRLNQASDNKEVLLGVLVQEVDLLRNNQQSVTEKILRAFGLESEETLSKVSLEQIIAFYRILIHRDSAISETVKFLEKFFKGNQPELTKEDFVKTLSILTLPLNKDKPQAFNRLVQAFLSNNTIEEHSNLVNFSKFKQIFMTNTLNIYDMIDLICGRS